MRLFCFIRSPGRRAGRWIAAGLAAVCLAAALPSSAADPAQLKIPSQQAVDSAIRRGIDFLVTDQNPDGSWGSPERTKDLNVFAPVPGAHHGFRAAVTAMSVEALLESGLATTSIEASNAVRKGTAWLIKNLPLVRRADAVAMYNVWAHAYGIQVFAALHRRETDPSQRRLLRSLITDQIGILRRYESVDGGWGYYDFRVGSKRPASSSTSFVTASVLLALDQAREIGVEIPSDLVQRGVDSLHRQQKKDFTYAYGEYLKMRPMLDINRPAGSLGRSQSCNLALRVWGDTNITDAVLTNWLGKFVARNEWLGFARKRPVPHESWFMVAGYFFYYGHYYAALCAEALPPQDRSIYLQQIAALLLPLQEKDGSWWDFPLYNYHQQYGTAYAVMTLSRFRSPGPLAQAK